MGAKKTFEGKVVSLVYDFPDRRIKKSGGYLRLRSRGKKVELTFKQGIKQGKVKAAIEHEVRVGDGKTLQKILSGIGLELKRKTVSHRTSYEVGAVHVDVDKYPGIPPYFEIEAPRMKELEKWVKKLGYTMRETNSWTTGQVFEYYKKSLR